MQIINSGPTKGSLVFGSSALCSLHFGEKDTEKSPEHEFTQHNLAYSSRTSPGLRFCLSPELINKQASNSAAFPLFPARRGPFSYYDQTTYLPPSLCPLSLSLPFVGSVQLRPLTIRFGGLAVSHQKLRPSNQFMVSHSLAVLLFIFFSSPASGPLKALSRQVEWGVLLLHGQSEI